MCCYDLGLGRKDLCFRPLCHRGQMNNWSLIDREIMEMISTSVDGADWREALCVSTSAVYFFVELSV